MFKKFLAKKSGNVAITFGIALMPIMLSIGAAIDYSRAANLHNKVAQATDAALLAAVSTAMNEEDLDDTTAVLKRLNEEFEPFFMANISNANSYKYNGFKIKFDPITKDVSVDVDIDYNTAVFGIVGINHWDSDVVAATQMQLKAGGAISMFLVLDRSGSMGWSNGDGGSKMQSLQTAVSKMISDFGKSDPKRQFIRLGAVAYSSYMWSNQKLVWRLNKADNYVKAMYADGGTDSSDSVLLAYKKLKSKTEKNAHFKKNGQEPSLVMVFMTDGDNNYSNDDTSTLNTCKKAKAIGIEIYTVAFQAPKKGQSLLNACATDNAHYFEPENTEELIQSFKNIGAKTAEKLVLAR